MKDIPITKRDNLITSDNNVISITIHFRYSNEIWL